jgi:NAD(P)-dependent dehydrogenase (short-subunit alcohol dehydrogenase family)
MYMSVIEKDPSAAVYPELAGARVLITGLSAGAGLDVARAFAEHGCRLVLQAEGDGPEITAIGEVLSQADTGASGEIKLFTDRLAIGEAAVKFAQTAAQAFGGLQVVVNLVSFSAADFAGAASMEEIESLVSTKLLPMTLLTRVVSNRMRLTMTEGLVLNVILMPEVMTAAERAVAGIARAAIAALTRGEAQQWAGEGLRINAIAPPGIVDMGGGACLDNEADIAALALHLASRRGKRLSGLVFDASGFAGRRC